MDYVVVAAPAPQAPLSPKKVSSSSSSSNILEGYTCLTSSDGRKYYMHHASGRCSLPAPPHTHHACFACPAASPLPLPHAPRRGTWSAPGTAQAAAEAKEVGGVNVAVFVLLMCALQLEQLLVSGVPRQQAGGSYVASLLRMALLGVVCAYAYLWLRAKFA